MDSLQTLILEWSDGPQREALDITPEAEASVFLTAEAFDQVFFRLSPVVGFKVWLLGQWVEKPVKVWMGGQWVTKPLKRWNSTAWI